MNVKQIAREIAEGSIVLLKNEGGLLPLAAGKTVAFFGRAQLETVLSGNGSGAANTEDPANILEECEKKGLRPVAPLADFYRQTVAKLNADKPQGFDFSQLKHMVNSGLMYEFFGKYTAPAEEFPVPADLIAQSAGETDTALLVIGRQSGGEECDRHFTDDYTLSVAEQALLDAVCGAFPKVAVVLNINGLIDLKWVEAYPSIQSLLFLGVPGEEGPAALANLLCGAVTPSGKLAVTIAREYEDYPAWADFSWDKDHPEAIKTYADYGLDAAANGSTGMEKSPVTVYREGIYLGYRYFDSFGKRPLFPFGFGLSYTTFALTPGAAAKSPEGLQLAVQVQNTGACSGKEVVQLYVSATGTAEEHPYQELKAFAKTALLAPGAGETVTLTVPWERLAIYRERDAATVIEKGTYLLRVGNSSAATQVAGMLRVPEDILIHRCGDCLPVQPCNAGKIDFLSTGAHPDEAEGPALVLTPADVVISSPQAPAVPKVDWSRFSLEELAALCVGYGPGVPFAAWQDVPEPNTIFDADGNPLTTNSHPTGFNGYVSPAIEGKGIRSVFYQDGPASVGGVAWPSEMLLACSFDVALCRRFGDAVGQECEELRRVDVWLAPAMNLHRHPLGGRNFEYLSEDPYLSGACAVAVAKGVQENHPVLVCAKHFAVNEQETYRRGSAKKRYDAVDSILTQRAARELYLKPFEMLVKEAGLHCIMTSFNKINGVFAGGNRDLCTHILREEWGFDGIVVTDWGDMDQVVDGADAVAAGNDIVMPGGPPVIAQILAGCLEGRVDRPALETAVGHLLGFIARFGRYTRQA